MPSKAYMETKTLNVEGDDPRAERLTEMSGIAELQEDCRTTSMDENGLVNTEKSSKETSLTHNSKQLGAKL
eukprot:12389765-Karenia_brevis.AAC.1